MNGADEVSARPIGLVVCAAAYLYILFVCGPEVRFDPAVEIHLIRTLGWLRGWAVDLRGPQAGPLDLYLGPLTYALYAVPLRIGAGVFGVLALQAIGSVAALWQVAVIARRTLPPAMAALAPFAMLQLLATPFFDATISQLTHVTFIPLAATTLLLALARFTADGEPRRWRWLALACGAAAAAVQLHPVGVTFVPTLVIALVLRRRDLAASPRRLAACVGVGLLVTAPLLVELLRLAGAEPQPLVEQIAERSGSAEPLLATLPGFLWRTLGPGHTHRWLLDACAALGLVAGAVGVGAWIRRAVARRATPIEWILMVQLASGLAVVAALASHALKPHYLHGAAYAFAVATPVGLSVMARSLGPVVIARAPLVVLVLALLALGEPLLSSDPSAAVPSADRIEQVGAALARDFGLDPATADRKVHGFLRDRQGGLRYAVAAGAPGDRRLRPDSRLVLVPAGIEARPLAIGEIRTGVLAGTAPPVFASQYRSAVDYSGVRIDGRCAPPVPYQRLGWGAWGADEVVELLGLEAEAGWPTVCPTRLGAAWVVDVPLRPGRAGQLNLVLDAYHVGTPEVTATLDGAPVLAGVQRLPPAWELRWVTFEIPERRAAATVQLEIRGYPDPDVLDVF